MKRIFVLGIGRSGTTLLSKSLALSSSKLKMLIEPFSKLKYPLSPDKRDMNYVSPKNYAKIKKVNKKIADLTYKNEEIEKNLINDTVYREDNQYNFFIMKEVHSLLTFPKILENENCKIIIIIRNTPKTCDSFFARNLFKFQMKYFVEEYKYIRKALTKNIDVHKYLKSSINNINKNMKSYIKKPIIFTKRIYRHAITIEIIKNFLVNWSNNDNRVKIVSFEDLCLKKIEVIKDIYNFTNLNYNHNTIKKIKNTTQGNEKDTYSIKKDSKKIISRDYKYLNDKQVEFINKLIK